MLAFGQIILPPWLGSESYLSLKGAWSGSRDQVYNFAPHEIWSSERLKLQTSNFVHGLATRSTNLQMTNCPLSGRVRATWRILEFHTAEISLERLKLESSNFVCVQAMSNVSRRTADHPWRRCVQVTWSLAARGCLPPDANVFVAAPANQISSAIRVGLFLGFRTWRCEPTLLGPLLFLPSNPSPRPLSSTHFPPCFLPFHRSGEHS